MVAKTLLFGAFLLVLLANGSTLANDPTGAQVFAKWCVHCHGLGREGHPGTQRLLLDHGPERAHLTERPDLQPQYIKAVVRRGLKEMPSFRPVEISDTELDALSAYIRGD